MREVWEAEVMYQSIQKITEWLDISNRGNDDLMPGEDDFARIAKMGEEAGEAISAYIGYIGQNPRKGRTKTLREVLDEAADVVVTGLCAIQHFTENTNETREIVEEKIKFIMERAAIEQELDT